MSVLIFIADFFNITLDQLIRIDLSNDSAYLSDNLLQNSGTINKNHLLVPISAQAGYTFDWTQEYVSQELRYLDLPFVEGQTRTFQVAGDSMEPLVGHGDYVVCRRFEGEITTITNTMRVVVLKREGITVKLTYPMREGLLLVPTNRISYEPTLVSYEDVAEVWTVIHKITSTIEHPIQINELTGQLRRMERLEAAVRRLEGRFGLSEGRKEEE